jgi:hypothetical protein
MAWLFVACAVVEAAIALGTDADAGTRVLFAVLAVADLALAALLR